MPDSVPGMV